MDVIGLGCALADSDWTSLVMVVASALGHGAIAFVLAVGLAASGMIAGRPRLSRAGLTGLAAIVASGILANLVKLAVALPRPHALQSSYGFPSGHTATAFAVAAVLGRAFPAAAPVLYLVAVLTGISRLYNRAHFTIDVLGGAVLGIASGLAIGAVLIPSPGGANRQVIRPRWRQWSWSLPFAVGAAAVFFFLSYERTLSAQRPGPPGASPPGAAIAFGTAEGRTWLVSGWSGDERWHGVVPFVWADGNQAVARLPSLPPVDHRLRLRLLPLVPHERMSCQRVELSVNGTAVGRLLVDRGWHEYEVRVPAHLLAAGSNELGFRFARAAPPSPADPRHLSVAFATLEAHPASGGNAPH